MVKRLYYYFKPKAFILELYKKFVFELLPSSGFRNHLVKKNLSLDHNSFYIGRNFKCSTKHFKLGAHSFINHEFSCYGKGNLEIGKYTQIAPCVKVMLGSHEINNMKPISGDVTIGDKCWIGANVTILPGVKIGDGAVIGANSLVNQDIPPNVIAVGAPAKVLKDRLLEYPYYLADKKYVLKEGDVLEKDC